MLEERTGIPTIGVLPWLDDVGIAEEDSLALPRYRARPIEASPTDLDVAVVEYPHIANFDDFDPLRRTPGVVVRFVTSLAALGRPALIILPGSKSTVADLAWLRATGLAGAVVDARHAGTPVVGICGGFQMLGRSLADPERVESSTPESEGLGLLDLTTTFGREKRTEQVRGFVADDRGLLAGAGNAAITAYEIHMGQTIIGESHRAAFAIGAADGSRRDGLLDEDGLTLGCYLHGLFRNDAVRAAILAAAARGRGVPAPTRLVPTRDPYVDLATLVRARLDLSVIRQSLDLTRAEKGNADHRG
jgi:adenosylcobyric acid synthase